MKKEIAPAILVIPTGIGCSVGGYAGDAIPSARLLAAASGCLITHPNVMNGANLYWQDPQILYVEGYAIDRFAEGEIALKRVKSQKVGILMDDGITGELRQRHLQVADACKASLGLDIGPCVTTDIPLDIDLCNGSNGSSWGLVSQPDALIRGAEKLIQLGATAIAVITRFPDQIDQNELAAYRNGSGVDTLSGAEAVISHLIVKKLGVPCAHAPALSPLPVDINLDPRAAGEEIGYTFLPSVLVGLSRAPDLVAIDNRKTLQYSLSNTSNFLDISQVSAVVAPKDALGGEAVLACIEKGIPLIAVSNPCVLKVGSNSLCLNELQAQQASCQVFYVDNYVEAAGVLLALREGVNVNSLYRPI